MVTITVRLRLAPEARLPIVGQVTTPPVSVPRSEAEKKVTPPGNVSVTTTPVAVLGPELDTVSV